ncbi:hypothetical protein JCM9803A_03090 [Rhodococcus erythropolis]
MGPLTLFFRGIDGKLPRVDRAPASPATDFCDEYFTADIMYKVHGWGVAVPVGIPPPLQHQDDLA